MPIRMNCPGCDRQYNLADTMRGKRVSCKSCAQGFTVGGSAGPKEDSDALVSGDAFNSPRSSSRKSRARFEDDEDVRPLRRRDRDDDDEYEESRPRKRKKKGSNGLVLGLVLGGVGLLVTVAVILVLVFTLGSGKFTVENFKKMAPRHLC